MFTRKPCMRLAADFFRKEAGKSTQAIEPAQEWI
jgi:hypothetical protein